MNTPKIYEHAICYVAGIAGVAPGVADLAFARDFSNLHIYP